MIKNYFLFEYNMKENVRPLKIQQILTRFIRSGSVIWCFIREFYDFEIAFLKVSIGLADANLIL